MSNFDGCLSPGRGSTPGRDIDKHASTTAMCGGHLDSPCPSVRLRRHGQPLPYLQPVNTRPFKKRRWEPQIVRRYNVVLSFTLLLTLFISRTNAAFVNFQNCMPDNIVNSNPLVLQWIPLWVDAVFNRTASGHKMNITLYGNVSGQTTVGSYPPPDSPTWSDPSDSFGKFVNISPTTNTYTTLFSKYNVLTYIPYSSPGSQFCESTVGNTVCPIAPRFNANPSDPSELAAFSVGHQFGSSYAFSTIDATIRVQSGDKGAPDLACISANITPALGRSLAGVLTYIPMVVLVFVAFATMFAGMYSPWGTIDPFRWTSNYGRDHDLLRLVTPGFGDCLQYVQFIVLAGSLTLDYPGYFQPVVSQVSWSALMFNESFVSHGSGTQSLVDGIYVTNGTYGLTTMSQLVGMTSTDDIWAGMVVWTLVIVAVIIALCELAFMMRWILRMVIKNAKEDLRRKNWPFIGGILVRIVCNFFLLPIVSLSMFQLVLGGTSPGYLTALAVVLLVAILAFGVWILRLIFTTKPRSHLFDDLPIVLLYGPLYNTYSDDAAPFALIPALLTFVRGVAIGAIQPSGVAQLVILAICEVILIITLHAFRPFHSPTWMNAYHTFFASVRLAVVLLMVAFVPSLGVTQPVAGWIGYVILILHGIVLVFGFFLNAVQRIVEVGARLAGAGGEEGTGAATRGGLVKVFGVRQLSRRQRRPPLRQSLTSDAAVLTDDADAKSVQYGGTRSRSVSANSAILLNKPMSRTYSRMSTLDQQGETDPETPYEHSTFSFLTNAPPTASGARNPDAGIRGPEPTDPYYRAPRPRRITGELMAPGAKSRASWASGDWTNRIVEGSPPAAEQFDKRDSKRDSTGWPIVSMSPPPQGAPLAAYRSPDEIENNPVDPRLANIDYAVRESDFYYGVRGPALSSMPTRKLKTGPADPVGPVSSASGWFKGMFGRKSKDSGKGFEVVRSSRAPPAQFSDGELSPQVYPEQYHDSPLPHTEAYLPGQQTRANEAGRVTSFDAIDEHTMAGQEEISDSDDELADEDAFPTRPAYVSDIPPSLAPIETGGDIELPSRFNSRVSRASRTSRRAARNASFAGAPALPRKSSRRLSQADPVSPVRGPRLTTIMDGMETRQSRYGSPQPRVPFTTPLTPQERNRLSAGADSVRSIDNDPAVGRVGHRRAIPSNAESLVPPPSALDRPTSVGFVNQYRASESIQHAFERGVHAGSSAEVIDSASPRSFRRRSVGSEQRVERDV